MRFNEILKNGEIIDMFYFLAFAISVVLILCDQISKFWAVTELKHSSSVTVIDNFFYLTYLENDGAAWGTFKGGRIFFIVFTVFIVCLIIIYFIKVSKRKKSSILSISLILIFSGAVGNLIDRLKAGYVVDMIHFVFFGRNFPVFNVADIFVVTGTALFAFYTAFLSDSDKKTT